MSSVNKELLFMLSVLFPIFSPRQHYSIKITITLFPTYTLPIMEWLPICILCTDTQVQNMSAENSAQL